MNKVTRCRKEVSNPIRFNIAVKKSGFTISSLVGVLGTLLTSAPASAVPVAVMNTGGCITSSTATSQTCYQYGGAGIIFSQVNLANLTVTTRIDSTNPYSGYAQAGITYYMELLSSTGTFSGTIPLSISAHGYTEVGATGAGGYNNSKAEASINFFGQYSMGACAGYQCYSYPTTFGFTYPFDLQPFSSGSLLGQNVFEIRLQTRVQTNSNYPTSYGYAWVDPVIQIDPTFLLAHPEYSLAFSDNIPSAVPVPAAAWLLGSGLVGLIGLARPKSENA